MTTEVHYEFGKGKGKMPPIIPRGNQTDKSTKTFPKNNRENPQRGSEKTDWFRVWHPQRRKQPR